METCGSDHVGNAGSNETISYVFFRKLYGSVRTLYRNLREWTNTLQKLSACFRKVPVSLREWTGSVSASLRVRGKYRRKKTQEGIAPSHRDLVDLDENIQQVLRGDGASHAAHQEPALVLGRHG